MTKGRRADGGGSALERVGLRAGSVSVTGIDRRGKQAEARRRSTLSLALLQEEVIHRCCRSERGTNE